MQRKIKDIRIGDYVKSWDFDNGKVVRSKVLEVIDHKNDDQCFNLNYKLTITGSHQVYTKDGYKLTKDIQIGDKLLDSSGKYTRVKSFKLCQLDVPYVHNLKVKTNNYFANGILVHNGGGSSKAGKWHGRDKAVDPSMRSLRESLVQYKESTNLLSEQIAEQTGDIAETLELQRTELLAETEGLSAQGRALGLKASAEKTQLKKQVGRTNLATVGTAQMRELEFEKQAEGRVFGSRGQALGAKREGVELKSQQETDALQRDKDTQELSMKAALSSQVNSSYAAAAGADSFWSKMEGNNPFANGMSADAMVKKWDEGHSGYYNYCVTPNTEVEMWDE